ncbi:MAG: PBP1b-binding outer membrane lipoprotein LpoB, partial [Alteromonadaceae bacterium]
MQKLSSLVLASSITLLLSGCANTDSTTELNAKSSSAQSDTLSSRAPKSNRNEPIASYTPDIEPGPVQYSQNGEIT